MQHNVLIVNPGSSGKLIRSTLQARGIRCDALFSAEHDPTGMLDRKNQSLYQTIYESIDEVINKKYSIQYHAILPGSELGVEHCDLLADKLNLPGNSPQTTGKRRNKFEMQKALADHQLNHIASRIVKAKDEVATVLTSLNADKYIVKPINAAGSENVYLCHTKQEVVDILATQSWGEINCTGKVNNEFVIQEYIAGEEYALDFIVIDGIPIILSLCKYDKGNGVGKEFVYKGVTLLDPQDTHFTYLIDYARAAIKALDIVYGPVHMELINKLPANTPFMVEVATRLHGGVAPDLFQHCYQPHLLQSLAKLVTAPTILQKPASLHQHGYIYFHVCKNEGTYVGIPDTEIAHIFSLASVKGFEVWTQRGEKYQITRDLFSCPAIAWLSHQSPLQIQKDIATIQHILKKYF
jgi:biotin carboxylase